MKIELPTQFDINYPKNNKRYYSTYSKPKITKLLYNSCHAYCMYCGKTVNIEGDRNFHLEHSVDKDGNECQEGDPFEVLKHCKYNLAIACVECNTVCKKVVEKVNLEKYAPLPKCPSKCEEMCDLYIQIREEYMMKNAIILQPEGKDQPIRHLIAYNLLKHVYQPNCSENFEEVNFFIQNHIDRFELNGRRFSPCIIDICCKTYSLYEKGIEGMSDLMDALKEDKHFNVLGDKFLEFLNENFFGKKIEELIEFCKLLVVLDAVP